MQVIYQMRRRPAEGEPKRVHPQHWLGTLSAPARRRARPREYHIFTK
jgi:hypothetical protein